MEKGTVLKARVMRFFVRFRSHSSIWNFILWRKSQKWKKGDGRSMRTSAFYMWDTGFKNQLKFLKRKTREKGSWQETIDKIYLRVLETAEKGQKRLGERRSNAGSNIGLLFEGVTTRIIEKEVSAQRFRYESTLFLQHNLRRVRIGAWENSFRQNRLTDTWLFMAIWSWPSTGGGAHGRRTLTGIARRTAAGD